MAESTHYSINTETSGIQEIHARGLVWDIETRRVCCSKCNAIVGTLIYKVNSGVYWLMFEGKCQAQSWRGSCNSCGKLVEFKADDIIIARLEHSEGLYILIGNKKGKSPVN